MMAKKATAAKQPDETPETARARLKRLAPLLDEEAGNQPAVPETADDLKWLASGIKVVAADETKSLDRTLGLVRRRGNPHKIRHRYGTDERTVRRERQRRRIENERAEIAKIPSRTCDRLEKSDQVEHDKRVDEVRRFDREHHIKPGA
jgi:hypothetical protein